MRTIDKLLDAEATYFKVRFRMVDLIFAAVMLALGLIFRLALYDIASGDYTLSFADWMRECHEAGGIAYLGIQPGVSDASTFDYNCMFQYIIVLLHYIGGGVKDIYLVKTVSVIFDVVCAVTIGRITFEATSGDVRKSVLAFGCIMFLPTSVLNSGAWAQNDAIFGSFLLRRLLMAFACHRAVRAAASAGGSTLLFVADQRENNGKNRCRKHEKDPDRQKVILDPVKHIAHSLR